MLSAAADNCEPVYVRFPDGDDVEVDLDVVFSICGTFTARHGDREI
jgi:hypothetical protein